MHSGIVVLHRPAYTLRDRCWQVSACAAGGSRAAKIVVEVTAAGADVQRAVGQIDATDVRVIAAESQRTGADFDQTDRGRTGAGDPATECGGAGIVTADGQGRCAEDHVASGRAAAGQ